VSSCQTSSKLATRFLRYRDFSIYKMAAVRHLGFLNFKFNVARQVGRANMHRHTKFHQSRSNGCRDITFNVFKIDIFLHFLGSAGIMSVAFSLKSVKPLLRYSNLAFFPRWRPSAIFNLWDKRPIKSIWWSSYHCTNVGWNRFSRFNNIKV